MQGIRGTNPCEDSLVHQTPNREKRANNFVSEHKPMRQFSSVTGTYFLHEEMDQEYDEGFQDAKHQKRRGEKP